DNTVRIWLWSGATHLSEIAALQGHKGEVRSVVFSPDQSWYGRAASGGVDGTVQIWDLRGGNRGRPHVDGVRRGHEGSVNSVGFSRDGRRIASASRDGTVRIWDAKTGCSRIMAIPASSLAVFSPDGRWIASKGEDRRIHLWDVRTGLEAVALQG